MTEYGAKTMSDELRDRIEDTLRDCGGYSWRDKAQAIIDDLHLEPYEFTRHDGHTTQHVHGWMEKK